MRVCALDPGIIALVALILLWRFKEPFLVLAADAAGLLLH